jgi:adenosylcobyric acid synthase
MNARAIMVLGTGSDAGKSLTVAAFCRMLKQEGVRVAPFKAQNMALNSFATRDGHEIGRAQAMQAQAAGVEPHVDMNPILLKPQSDVDSQVVLEGKVFGSFKGVDYYALRPKLVAAVDAAYQRLASRFDVVVLEGAGSPVEMNLKQNDVVNMRMAEIADAACVLVADIDRGGVFAQLVGTYELLEPDERARFAGFLVNKFRGDIGLFEPGVEWLERRLGWPCLGVIPYLRDHGVDDEDSVSLERRRMRPSHDDDALRVCVVGLPYMSNFTDFTALERAPGVELYYTREPDDARVADVIVLPGSKNTIPDLVWLRSSGWDRAIADHMARRRAVVGICGGFQMLGREVRDPARMESDVERIEGLGLLDVETVLDRDKVTRQATARLADPARFGGSADACELVGYEIHLGTTEMGERTRPLLRLRRKGSAEAIDDGALSDDGLVLGTYLHGLFDSASGLETLLGYLRRVSGKSPWTHTDFDPVAERERRYDTLADHFRRHLRIDSVARLCARRPSG